MSKYIFTQDDIEAWDRCFTKQQNILSIYNNFGETNQEFLKSYLHDYLVNSFKKEEYDKNYLEYFNFFNHLTTTDFPFVREMHNYLVECKKENYLYYSELLFLYTNCLKNNHITITDQQLKDLYPTINIIRTPSHEVIQSCVNLVSMLENNSDKNALLVVTLNKLLEKTTSDFPYDSQKAIYSYFKDFKKEQNLEKYLHYYPALKDENWAIEEDFFEKSLNLDINKILNYYGLGNKDLNNINNLIVHFYSQFVSESFMEQQLPNISLVEHSCKILQQVKINVRFSTPSQEQCDIIAKKFKTLLEVVLSNFNELTHDENLSEKLTKDYLIKICFNLHLETVVPQVKTATNKKKI